MLGKESYCEMLCDTSDCGSTALHIAAMGGNLQAVKLLVNHKAMTNIVNNDVQTPAHLAAKEGWHRWVATF